MVVNGFVYVIESPSDVDLLDGRSEGRVLCQALKLAGIPHWYSLVTSPKTFEMSLQERLVQSLKAHPNMLPILHFSMHGNNEGIQISSGDFLSWTQLRHAIAPLNNQMNGSLLISMSSCMGGSGCRMAMHDEKSPSFWALVGNSGEALWSDAAVAYVTFYHLFFKGVAIDECVAAMRKASGDQRFMAFFGADVRAGWDSFQQRNRAQALAELLLNRRPTAVGALSQLFDSQPPGPEESASPDMPPADGEPISGGLLANHPSDPSAANG
jgi:hypothetical protein